MLGYTLASIASALLVFGQVVSAAPAVALEERSGVTTVSASTISSLTPYINFAKTGYCASSKILTGSSSWTCGAACQALPGFIPYITGGDGNAVPLYYVGYWPAQNTAVVVHEGTDPTQFESLLTDAIVPFGTLSNTLFPGIGTAVQVHSGFRDAHAKSAAAVLAAVKKVMSEHGTTKVTVVGHSLGGALSFLEAVYLRLNLATSTTFKIVTLGCPRVGNQDWADYIDSHFSDVTRLNNLEDLIPIVPGRFLGFHHPKGEIHITDEGPWVACAGQDNTDDRCTTGDVSNIFLGEIEQHLGPYSGIWIGTIFC